MALEAAAEAVRRADWLLLATGAGFHGCLFDPGGGRQQGRLVKLWKARSKLYRRRFLRPNTHFSAFFEIYKIHTPSHRFDTQKLQMIFG